MPIYNTKYKVGVQSILKKNYELFLKLRNYSGPVYDLKGGSDPIFISTPKRQRKYRPIIGTELKTSLIYEPKQTNYNILDDFNDITDREWQAELRQNLEGNIYKASGKLEVLDVIAPSSPASATMTLTALPTGVDQLSIDHFFRKSNLQSSGPLATYIVYAKPANSSTFGALWEEVARTTAGFAATTEDIIDGFVINNSDITKTGEDTFNYTIPGPYNGFIDGSYNIIVVVDEKAFYSVSDQSTTNRFTVTSTAYIEVLWRNRSITSSIAESIQLAKHVYLQGDSIPFVVQELRDQINGTQGYFLLEGVVLSPGGTPVDIRVSATSSYDGVNGYLNLFLNGIGGDGNGILLTADELNQTYCQVIKDPNSTFAYLLSNPFTGGVTGGDQFTFESCFGNVSILAESGDTSEQIIARLVDAINASIAIVDASVDESDLTRFNVTTEQLPDGCTYAFTTTGSSTTSDNGPNWLLIEASKTIWVGYVAPGFNQNKHIPGNQVLNISALCGLGDLKNFTFEYNERRPFEKLTLITIIAQVLSNTGLDLKIHEAFDLYEVSMDYTKPPLEQVYEDTMRLNGATNYAVLAELLPFLKATITQVEGHWELRPIDQLKNTSIDYRVYTSTGQYVGVVTDSSHIKEVGSCTPNKMLNASTVKRTQSPFRQLITQQNFGFVSQLIRFPAFSNLNSNLTQDNYNPQYPWRWVFNDVAHTATLDKVNVDEDGILRINAAVDQVNRMLLQQKVLIGKVEVPAEATERDFELKLEYEVGPVAQGGDLDSSPAIEVEIQVKFKDNGTTLYLFEEDSDNPVQNPVSVSPGFITLDNRSDKVEVRTFTQTFNYPFETNFTTEAEFLIRQPLQGYLRIKSAKIEINAQVIGQENKADYYIDADSDGIKWKDRVSSKIETIKLSLGDVPELPAASSLYKNAFLVFPEEVAVTSRLWSDDPAGESPNFRNLVSILRQFWLEEYATPYPALRGTIRGDVLLHHEIRDVTEAVNYLYMNIGGEWNVRLDQINAEWERIDLKTNNPIFPNVRVSEVLPIEKDSSGSNSYTSSAGGGISVPGEIGQDIDFPVDSVNNKTGDITLNADDIPDGNTSNKFVNATGKTLAETGGRIINTAIMWDGGLRSVNSNRAKFIQFNMENGTTEINLGLLFGTDSNSFSRDNFVLINNEPNSSDITTLDFRTDVGNWVWLDGSPPASIPAGTKWLLKMTNINNQAVIAELRQITGALFRQGIGFMIIEDTNIVG